MRAGRLRLSLAVVVLSTGWLACSSPDEGASPAQPAESAATPQPTQEPTEPAADGPAARSLRLDLLPAVAQPGTEPAEVPADPLFVAAVAPVSAGSEVELQRRGSAGWETESTAAQDDTGTVRFAVALSGDDAGETFRAVAVDPDGRQGAVSNTVDGVGWESAFADDFDGTALDDSRWSYRSEGVYNLEDDGRCSVSDRDAVQVRDGTVRLQVRRDPARMDEACATPSYGSLDYYLNGRIDTEAHFAFTYGVAAARVKFQQGRGQHGAFWLQRTGVPVVPGDAARSGAEVDIAEFFGEGAKDGGMGTYAYYTNQLGQNEKIGDLQPDATSGLPPGDTWWDAFHVFSVEWTPTAYVYRIDGREVFRTDRGVSGIDEFLVLSLSTKDWELARIDPDLLPSTMEVDWVRVWQQPGS